MKFLAKHKSVIASSVTVTLFFVIVKYVFPLYKIPSESMEPTIMTSDFVISSHFGVDNVKGGDIIVFREGDDIMIKRVIGVEGDKVHIENGLVSVNGDCDFSYLNPTGMVTESEKVDYVVPKNSVFVLGDNRGNSRDSRLFDDTYVSKDDIITVGVCSFGVYKTPHFKVL